MSTPSNSPAPSGGSVGLDPISSAVGIGTEVAKTISGIIDQTKKRQFEQSLAGLTLRQQGQLEDKLREANTQTDRMAILSNAMLQFAIANANNASGADTKLLLIAGALGVVLIGAAIAVSMQKT